MTSHTPSYGMIELADLCKDVFKIILKSTNLQTKRNLLLVCKAIYWQVKVCLTIDSKPQFYQIQQLAWTFGADPQSPFIVRIQDKYSYVECEYGHKLVTLTKDLSKRRSDIINKVVYFGEAPTTSEYENARCTVVYPGFMCRAKLIRK